MARAGAWAGARAWAWVGAGARAGARARAGVKTRRNYVDWLMQQDQAEEGGEDVFSRIKVGAVVMVECSQRWYIGRVRERNSVTFDLEDAATVHQITDLGQFLKGVITENTEITPEPDGVEVHLADVQTVRNLSEPVLKKLRRRTNAEMPEKTPNH